MQYFKAYCLKKMGFLYEAKDILHSLLDLPQLSDHIRFKVIVKLSKIYTDFWNHFEARFHLRTLKTMFQTNIDLQSSLNLKAAYYQAKCKYYLKLGIPEKLKTNFDKLLKCHDELQTKAAHRISLYCY